MLAAALSNGFVVGMGIGIVFLGLIFLVVITAVMGLIFKGRKEKNEESAPAPAAAPVTETIENKQEMLAAISAAVAEELGRDVSAIRILSFKKL